MSDGVFSKPLCVAHATRVHGVAPDAELLAHIRARGYVPPIEKQRREREGS